MRTYLEHWRIRTNYKVYQYTSVLHHLRCWETACHNKITLDKWVEAGRTDNQFIGFEENVEDEYRYRFHREVPDDPFK